MNQKIEVLVSTMYEKNFDLHKKMNLKENVTVINQFGLENFDTPKLKKIKNNIFYYQIKDRGLSKSRNMAIESSSGDICIIADNDVLYLNDYSETINDAYQKYPDADIIAFQVDRINGREKKFSNTDKKIKYLSSLKISSVEITFKRNSILKKELRFNEDLGAGSNYLMGEENEFLIQALNKGLKVYYVAKKIGVVDMSSSTWFETYNNEYFESRGASFKAMFPRFYWILIFQFIIRKRMIKKDSNMSYFQILKKMFEGSKMYSKKRCKSK